MKNSADQGGCYPQRPKAEVDNTLWDLQNSSYPMKAEFNNCFIIHSKYFLALKGILPFHSLFFCSPKITLSCSQAFSVNGSIICSELHIWCRFEVIGSIICSRLHFWCHFDVMGSIICCGLHFDVIGSIGQRFFPNLVNSSWLWWIMHVDLTNQKQGNIFNE